MHNKNKQRRVIRAILRWYERHGRTLPWRLPDRQNDVGLVGRTPGSTNPYRILLSEIMLQQTQVNRVLIKYPQFLRRFPTLRSLAKARQRDVVMEWQGMGYNNRAVRLHKLAQMVMQTYKGRFPKEYGQLILLPGIGMYTANALRVSAFGEAVPVVDVNVQRVLSRIFSKMVTTKHVNPLKQIWTLAGNLLPHSRAYDWNQALMDLGSSVCTARNPQCGDCPVTSLCASRPAMSRIVVHEPKREPSLDGIPNRMYRGRIVDALRKTKGTGSLRADQLGKRIHSSFGRRHMIWFRDLLSKLQEDGLIQVRGNGSLRTQFVSLA